MRFSLKWVLFGMAYVAVAAAAFSQVHWVYADLLWCAAFLAICYALLIAATAPGAKRIVAAGFAIFALAFALCAQFAGETTPTRRLLLAAGVEEWASYPPLTVSGTSPGTLPIATAAQAYSYAIPASPTSPQAAVGTIAVQPALPFTVSAPIEMPFASKLRAANAVGAMLLGLIGAWLAAVACRRRRLNSETSAA